MRDPSEVHWHAITTPDALRELETAVEAGLSAEEVVQRRQRFGPNEMTARAGTPAWLKFLEQFNQALVYILVAAAAVSVLLGEYVDASVIFGVVLVNAVVGFLQESKAEKAIAALSRMVRTEATVRRAGQKMRVPSAELVPGDLVLLQSGDRIPADLRLVLVRNLQVEEAALTGESVPSSKDAGALAQDTGLADRRNMAFTGTLVTYGQAEGLVCAVGDHTETGRIADMISSAANLSTPLTRKIAHFSRWLLVAVLALAALTFVVGVLRGNGAAEMFMAAVALAVGAIPEGLPAAVTITLAIGVSRMARRHAIIRKMPAVETLGSTTVICSDKTGTLTENQMTVARVYAGGEFHEVTGSGYGSAGQILRDGQRVEPSADAALAECLLCGLLCNDSQLVTKDGRLEVEGDPTEAALIVAAQKGGYDASETARQRPRVDVIPFESERMYMATLHCWDGRCVLYQKGSAEHVLGACQDALNAAGERVPLDAAAVGEAVDRMAADGLRVLAFARRELESSRDRLESQDAEGGLTFLGLQGMIDPPRAEAIRAVASCQRAGIAVKMITGDHAGTAAAVAAQLGLRGGADSHQPMRVITGLELERVSDESLAAVADETAVFARVAPEQKLRLVRALQDRGHVVAMTGDGVNDAPALKQANIGVAMGITGTDVAKGTADMILTDDNFASIEAAVEEGRNIFDNLTKFITWTIPTNAGEALMILLAVLAGRSLPLLPVQLLWVNMTTALLLGLMLVFEPKEAGMMDRPPRPPAAPILTPALLWQTALVSAMMVAGGFLLFIWERTGGTELDEARTIVVNVIVFVEAFYLLNCRSLTRTLVSIGPLTNRWILLGLAATVMTQLAFTYLPFMNRLFHTSAIPAAAWVKILGVGLSVFLVVELLKKVRQLARRRSR
ncbi:MAG: cation-transporting P-type ATPase [Planctomycetaceae bacterium]|nr:cation-transporting P-type ATPase [Planctomycetaceae bacterium]